MKQMVRGAIAILALSGLSACVDDPLLPLNGDADRIHANPVTMLVKQGDSSAVLLRLINVNNAATPTKFEVTNGNAGIVINLDTKYRPEYVDGSDTLIVPEIKSVQRYYIRGVIPGEYTYTVTSQGITGTFKVRVEPSTLGPAALNKTTAVIGETVTVTAPINTTFSPTATVTFAGGPNAVSARSADGKTISFIVGPNINGPVSVNGVIMDYYTAAGGITLTSGNNLVTPVLPAVPTTVSATAIPFGGAVTITINPASGLRFRPTSTVTLGATAAYVTARAADSSSMTVVPVGPQVITAVTLNDIVYTIAPTVVFSLRGDKDVEVGPVTVDPNTGAIATAPTFALPPVGTMAVLSGGGPFVAGGPCSIGTIAAARCTYYKVVLGAPLRVDAQLTWEAVSADMGLYLVNAAGTGATLMADASGAQTGGTESTAAAGVLLPAGTSYLAIAHYGATAVPPKWFQVRITGR